MFAVDVQISRQIFLLREVTLAPNSNLRGLGKVSRESSYINALSIESPLILAESLQIPIIHIQ